MDTCTCIAQDYESELMQQGACMLILIHDLQRCKNRLMEYTCRFKLITYS